MTDSGYSWVILVTSFLTCVITAVAFSSMGVILIELGKTFEATEVELNAAATLQFGMGLVVGKKNAKICKREPGGAHLYFVQHA